MLLLERPEIPVMRGRARTNPRTTPFAQWLADSRDAKGWSMRRLADEAGVTQPRIAQIEAGDGLSRELAIALAKALVPEDAEEDYARAFIDRGLEAAGYAAEYGGDFTDEDFQIIARNYNGLPASGRRMLREQSEALRRLVQEAQGQDTTHGKKAE